MNGFTLVELLAVFALIALVTLLIVPGLSNLYNSSRNKEYTTYEDMMVEYAKTVPTSKYNGTRVCLKDLGIDNAIKNTTCNGYVVKSNDTYTPYLSCSENGNNVYKTSGYSSSLANNCRDTSGGTSSNIQINVVINNNGTEKYTNGGVCYNHINYTIKCISNSQITSFTTDFSTNVQYSNNKTVATITGTSLSFTATCKDITGDQRTISNNYSKCILSATAKCPIKNYNYTGSCNCLNSTTGQYYTRTCSNSKPTCSAACSPYSLLGGSCNRSPVYDVCYHP